jgi:rare lipoprotein A
MRTSLSVAIVALSFLGFSTPAHAKVTACGEASYYGADGDGYAWQITSSGERMNPGRLTTAHRTLPFGTRMVVINRLNGRQVAVRVNDRGPFHGGRILDLSPAAFDALSSRSTGRVDVCYSLL